MRGKLIILAICIFLQILLFIPFYFKWKKDCKEIGKDNLAVSLAERFLYWCLVFPFWLVPIMIYIKGE